MLAADSVVAVYGEFVRKPYFVVIHTHIDAGHEAFDHYNPDGLTELVVSVLTHLTKGKKEILECMCGLDEAAKSVDSLRKRRYISENIDDLYPSESSHLKIRSIAFKGYWIGTNSDKFQAQALIALASAALEVPYRSIRKLQPFS